MAFTGTPVVVRITDGLFKIIGVSLASGAAGPISLSRGAGEVKAQDSSHWSQYAGQDAGDGIVQLVEAVQIYWNWVTDPGAVYGPSDRITVVKSGTDESDFLITMTSLDVNASESGVMEIYVRFH